MAGFAAHFHGVGAAGLQPGVVGRGEQLGDGLVTVGTRGGADELGAGDAGRGQHGAAHRAAGDQTEGQAGNTKQAQRGGQPTTGTAKTRCRIHVAASKPNRPARCQPSLARCFPFIVLTGAICRQQPVADRIGNERMVAMVEAVMIRPQGFAAGRSAGSGRSAGGVRAAVGKSTTLRRARDGLVSPPVAR